jgi:hypothetical protein
MKRDNYSLLQKIGAMLKLLITALFSIILIIVISVLHYILVKLGLLKQTHKINENERICGHQCSRLRQGLCFSCSQEAKKNNQNQ